MRDKEYFNSGLYTLSNKEFKETIQMFCNSTNKTQMYVVDNAIRKYLHDNLDKIDDSEVAKEIKKRLDENQPKRIVLE